MNLDFENEFKNQFKDNNEKSCSRYRNRVSPKAISKPYGRATTMPKAWELNSHIKAEQEINSLSGIFP